MITAAELDQKFDAGEDVLAYFDLDAAERPGLTQEDVNVSFPRWMVEQLDTEAEKLGTSRQAVIKFWLAERLERIQQAA